MIRILILLFDIPTYHYTYYSSFKYYADVKWYQPIIHNGPWYDIQKPTNSYHSLAQAIELGHRATAGLVIRSHRLELMRQIYNMNESAADEEESDRPPSPRPAPQPDLLQCISVCAQQTRLSLANLLPSRFVGNRRSVMVVWGFS